uniref:Probable oligoribonuclease n=1 Tax=Timema genevievae TaxID=629358 RepID=A0A7R9K7E1_TIMGE|nr:unnamed protein product [Timema genevievae]
MTGLDVLTCHILEVACLITDPQLNVLAQGPDLIINQPDHILDNMDTWCVEHHGQSGLTDACRKSKTSLQDAERSLMSFIKTYIPKGKCCIAGNSVYTDRLFLQRYMPLVDSHLHYRIVDVSTIKELCRRWNPQIYDQSPKKVLKHRALDDIRESIEELRYYRSAMFIKPDIEHLR